MRERLFSALPRTCPTGRIVVRVPFRRPADGALQERQRLLVVLGHALHRAQPQRRVQVGRLQRQVPPQHRTGLERADGRSGDPLAEGFWLAAGWSRGTGQGVLAGWSMVRHTVPPLVKSLRVGGVLKSTGEPRPFGRGRS